MTIQKPNVLSNWASQIKSSVSFRLAQLLCAKTILSYLYNAYTYNIEVSVVKQIYFEFWRSSLLINLQINLLSQEDMPIIICDVNKQNEQLATCFLPLKDALIHTNRRADMSLALVR